MLDVVCPFPVWKQHYSFHPIYTRRIWLRDARDLGFDSNEEDEAWEKLS